MIRSAALALLALPAADAASFTASGDRIYAAAIEGKPVRLRVDPGAPSMPVIHPEAAARLGLKAGPFAAVAKIGPVSVRGRSAVIDLAIPGLAPFQRRATWFTAPWAQGVDGVIGPGGLPAAVVRFDLRAPQPGERRVTLPAAQSRGGTAAIVTMGGEKLFIRLSPERPTSIATASAGALIAAQQRGAFDRAPETMPIFLGVERPVRHLALAAPFAVGPLAISGLMVRTSDFGSTAHIPEGAVAEPDPDEIVVTGNAKKKPRELRVELGRDYLDRCSSILFDNKAETVTLSCR